MDNEDNLPNELNERDFDDNEKEALLAETDLCP